MSSPLWSPGKSNNPSLIKLNELAKAKDFSELHNWSIENPADFWSFVVSNSEVVGDLGDVAISGSGFLKTEFFPAAQLNVVDTLLKGDPDQIVITEISESGQRRTFTRGEVRKLANQVAQSLLSAGVVEGDVVAACVGGGSNAIGIFTAFIGDADVRLLGLEAGGDGIETGRHASTIVGGAVGVLHGARSYIMQDDDGQTIESHSISAGLDYPSVGPEHAYLADIGRAEYRSVTDVEAMNAFKLLCETEGIIPAIETAHALAGAIEIGKELGEGAIILINLSGRGDKDVETAAKYFGIDL